MLRAASMLGSNIIFSFNVCCVKCPKLTFDQMFAVTCLNADIILSASILYQSIFVAAQVVINNTYE